MNDCFQFAPGSRQMQICEGLSELTLFKTNAFRRLYGLGPLEQKQAPDALRTPPTQVTQAARGKVPKMAGAMAPKGGCCGGKSRAPVVRPTAKIVGVGNTLIEMFKEHGFESCDACYALAKRMNDWGVSGCQEHLDEIVADILPRALEWEKDKLGWIGKLIPTGATAAAIRVIVEKAISATIPTTVQLTQPKRMSKQTIVNTTKFVNHSQAPEGPPIEVVDLKDCTRHLTFHVWPVSGYGAWQWNCDRLLQHKELFNGRRIVSIVTDSTTDSADDVKRYLADFTDEFIVMDNNPKLREVVTWLPMLQRLSTLTSDKDVTFSCHAKCVRHKIEKY